MRGNLIAERTRRGWTQEQVAERLKVNANTVSRWETGRTSPSYDNAKALADLYGCQDIRELMTDTSNGVEVAA